MRGFSSLYVGKRKEMTWNDMSSCNGNSSVGRSFTGLEKTEKPNEK